MITIIGDDVTNLNGKSLSKLTHGFIDILTKML